MADPKTPNDKFNLRSTCSTRNPSKKPHVIGNNTTNEPSGRAIHYPNRPEATNPDSSALREQWRFAIKQYGKWYSHAWGTAILAGLSFFALGWIIKGGNPLPSLHDKSASSSSLSDKDKSKDQT